MTKDNFHILLITPWYPYDNDPMFGLFVKRQAIALTKFSNVSVLAIIVNHGLTYSKKTFFSDNYFETVVTLSPTVWSCMRFFREFLIILNFFQIATKRFGRIRAVHAFIFNRLSLFGWLLSLVYHIPFIISEHWSRFLPENLSIKKSEIKIVRFLARQAKKIIVPSERLKFSMKSLKIFGNYDVIPNVILTDVFNFDNLASSPSKVILHVSCFEDKSKDLIGFVDAIEIVYNERKDFVVKMVGEGPDFLKIKNYVQKKNLNEVIHLIGLLSEFELALLMRNSAFLVLNSRYETHGIVVFEALSSGIPVVVTDVADMKSIINDNFGIVVSSNRSDFLADAINTMLDTYANYNRKFLRDYVVESMSEKNIGSKLFDIYKNEV